jgi:shikimate dehydrogenase
MVDGLGYVRALQAKGCELRGLRTLLVGAGGAGTAIAHALLESGVAELALHDVDLVRRDALIARLGSLGLGQVRPGSADPRGFDLAINATPMGMKLGDPMPLESDHWVAGQWVGCVITEPVVPPMIAAARAAGCHTVTGADMFEQVRDRLLRFLRGESL